MLKIEQIYIDYKIPYVTTNHKHARDGWINIECPFCTGNKGYHLGFNLDEEYYFCWRCGGHGVNFTLSKVLGVSFREIKSILEQYQTLTNKAKTKVKKETKPFELPSPLSDNLEQIHINYLENRGFDYREIIDTWQIKASGLYCKLDGIDYKWRILIPIFWNNKLVTFQTRDVTNKAKFKYLACPEAREKINIKQTLYGKQNQWTDVGIGVEGIFDVWRLGDNAVGLYGVKYTQAQIRLISKRFKRFFVIFDNDTAGQKQASKMVAELNFRGIETYNYKLPKGTDPADLKPDEAKILIKELKTWKIK